MDKLLRVEDGHGDINSGHFILPAILKGSTLTSLRPKNLLHMTQIKPYLDCSFSRSVKN